MATAATRAESIPPDKNTAICTSEIKCRLTEFCIEFLIAISVSSLLVNFIKLGLLKTKKIELKSLVTAIQANRVISASRSA